MQDDREKKKSASDKSKVEIKLKSEVLTKNDGATNSQSQKVEKKENQNEFLVEFGPEVSSSSTQKNTANDDLGDLFGSFTIEPSGKVANNAQNQTAMSDVFLLGNSTLSSNVTTNNKIDTNSILALYGSSNSQLSTPSFQQNPNMFQNQYQAANQFPDLFQNKANQIQQNQNSNKNLFDFDLFENSAKTSNVTKQTVPADLWHM